MKAGNDTMETYMEIMLLARYASIRIVFDRYEIVWISLFDIRVVVWIVLFPLV
jgi:hypothetical protein